MSTKSHFADDGSPQPSPRSSAPFVALSCFAVANGMEAEVRQAFRARPHSVDGVAGFLRMEVMQPAEDASEFWLMTFWTDEESFRAWHRSHRYADAHAGIPKGLKLVRGRTRIRYFAMSAPDDSSPAYSPAGFVADRERIAAEIVSRHFARNPDLARRYGDSGRSKCEADARYHILYLAEAVAASSPELFRNYAVWLSALLGGLGLPPAHLLTQLQTLAEVLSDREPSAQTRTAVGYLRGILADPAAIDSALDDYIGAPDTDTDLTARVLDALLAFDRRRALEAIDEAAASGLSLDRIYLGIFQPLLREVGKRWQTNGISVAQEHYCTAAIQLMMGRLSDRVFAGATNGFSVVAACVGEELHDVGLRMVADLLQAAGWDSRFLGADVPVRDLLRALRAVRADALCLSVTLTSHLARTHEVIQAIRAEPDLQRLRIVVGGYPFIVQPDLWRRMHADGHAADARSAVAVCNRLVGHRVG